jgi:hypothetical protein
LPPPVPIVILLAAAAPPVSIDVSLDGVNPHDFIPPLSTLIVDFQTNHADSASFGTGTLNVRKGQILYGKTAANPTFLQMVGYK